MNRIERTYYSTKGYWKGLSAVKRLASAARIPETEAREWLKKQAFWQIYLPAPKHIPRPIFDVLVPNKIHQADLLFLPHDKIGRKTYKYALTVVDIASKFKEAEPLTSKTSVEVARALSEIYKRSPLKWPNSLQVDPGKEFMGSVTELLNKRKVDIRRGNTDIHRDQGLVERWNRTLAEKLFGYQYAKEMINPSERSTEWVVRLPKVVYAMNNSVTRTTGVKPIIAIKSKVIKTKKPSYNRPVGVNEIKLSATNQLYRYLYQPGELEGGQHHRATDPIWSIDKYRIGKTLTKSEQPVLYYLEDGPKRGFVREELLPIPDDTHLPPDGIL